MIDIREAGQKHFKQKRGELRSIEVPEWSSGGEVARVFFYGTPTGEEWVEILNFVDQATGHLDMRAYIAAFQLFARDEKGARLFNRVAGRDQLAKEFDFDVLKRLVNEMGVLREVSDDEDGAAARGKLEPGTTLTE